MFHTYPARDIFASLEDEIVNPLFLDSFCGPYEVEEHLQNLVFFRHKILIAVSHWSDSGPVLKWKKSIIPNNYPIIIEAITIKIRPILFPHMHNYFNNTTHSYCSQLYVKIVPSLVNQIITASYVRQELCLCVKLDAEKQLAQCATNTASC